MATASEQRPVRVLSLIKGLGPGGAEQLLLLTTSVADPDRVEHRVAYVRPDKTHLVAEFERAGVRPMRLGQTTRGPLGVVRALRREMAAAEVVHVHSPVLAATARLVARSLPAGTRPPVVTTEHNEWSSHRLATRVANAATCVLDAEHWAVSDQVRDTVWRPLRGGFTVLVHGIDISGPRDQPRARSEVRDELGVRQDEVLVLTVANLRRNKDYPNLLAAASLALAQEPRLRFAAIGQGPLAKEIEERRDKLGLAGRFDLLGYRRDVPSIMAAADIFVLGSAHEGLPVAVMEAFAAGLPVVATAVGGVPDQVRDGIEGRIVPAADPAALASALLDLVRDPRLRDQLASAAHARAAAYDIRRAVEVQTQAYERLAQHARG